MNRFGFQWPDSLDCAKFPADSATSLCVGENRTSIDREQQQTGSDERQNQQHATESRPETEWQDYQKLPSRLHCPARLRVPESLGYRIELNDQTVGNCGLPCSAVDNSIETGEDHQPRRGATHKAGRTVVLVAAVLCLLSTMFTMMTFAIDRARFRYPERSLVFFAMCYFFVSNAYFIGPLFGRQKVSCVGPFNGTGSRADVVGATVVAQGTQNELCSVVFAVVYFFGMAASIWWVVLALTWFLAAGLKWGREAIESHSVYYHLAAWAMPAVQTFAVLGTGSVGGEPLASVCSAGGASPTAARVFVILPLCAYLVVGTIFLVAGFVAMFRIRTAVKRDGSSSSSASSAAGGVCDVSGRTATVRRHGHHMVGTVPQTQKLDRLIVRLGVFGVLYTAPAAVVVACLVYEQSSLDSRARRQLHAAGGDAERPDAATDYDDGTTVFIVRHVMTLLIGFVSGFWVWSGKTAASWRDFCRRLQPENSSPSGGAPPLPARV